MMPENLHETIACIRNGDRTAFRKLVTMYQQPAYRLAFRILGNEEEARDAIQECFIKVWQKIGSFDTSREFVPWMYRILANTSLDRLRTMKRQIAGIFRVRGNCNTCGVCHRYHHLIVDDIQP